MVVYKETFDIFINLKKELQNFEDSLEKCEVKENKTLYKLNIPSIGEIKNPNFGNSIMELSTDFGFKGKIIDNFILLFSENSCYILSNTEEEYLLCSNYYNDFLFKGIEQCVSKMNSFFGTIIEELDSIKADGSKFKTIFNDSIFHKFEIFIVDYYERAILYTGEIFISLGTELIDQILNTTKLLKIIYIIVTLASFLIMIYLIYSLHKIFNTFLYFIGILPFKYLIEDDKLYNEIINFGNHYFGDN